MADHIDAQIEAAAATLLTGLATTGANVFRARVYPLTDAELPGLCIYCDESEIIALAMGGASRPLTRQITLRIEFHGKAAANYTTQANAVKKEVEIAMANDHTLGGLLLNSGLTRIESDRGDSAEQVIVQTRMVYQCLVNTAANAPDTPL